MYDEKEQKTASANKERELPIKPTLGTDKKEEPKIYEIPPGEDKKKK